MISCTSDLLIIGGGPAGLSAAINGASEGLNVRLLDNGSTLGGQAKESSAIENYPGFPEGITGELLMGRMAQQARKFATGVVTPVAAQALERNTDGTITVTCDDYTEYVTRSVLLSIGLSYRRLRADNIGHFMGRGVFYGVPTFKPRAGVRTVAVVGGANSAGQAALGLAANSRLDVKLLSRGPLSKGMSTYLIDRIAATPNIQVIEMCEVKVCEGDTCLRRITAVREGDEVSFDVESMYIFIGAMPRTLWLKGTLSLDEHNFVTTGDYFIQGDQPGYPPQAVHRAYYETSMSGVFAAGDVRSGSTKRIATSIGEGAGALQMIHSYLARS
jgi:thioredoxin reductase (NADPH)